MSQIKVKNKVVHDTCRDSSENDKLHRKPGSSICTPALELGEMAQ